VKKVNDFILLKKEAYLFDAKLYILKAFISIVAAYAIVRHLPLVHKDMISVLFGLMMTLEPVTVTGIRSGLRQITATILGALATAIIIALFGINIWTVALTVSATLFLCLKINWREVSPVAIFTSIYMTQYVQYSINGEPSVILTFQLRILALGIGVLTAIICNFLFSLLFYKQMERKRIAHIMVTITDHLRQLKQGIEEGSMDIIHREKEILPSTFTDIDWLYSLLKDKEKEAEFKKRLHLNSASEELFHYQRVIINLRNLTHLIYDTICTLTLRLQEITPDDRKKIAAHLQRILEKSSYLAKFYENASILPGNPDEHIEVNTDMQERRIMDNLTGISKMLDHIDGPDK